MAGDELLPRYARKKAQTRQRIYQAALELFAKHGLTATTVDQITARADVAKGTFFNYFRSKEQVFAYFIELQLGRVGEALAAVQQGRPVRPVLRRAFQRLGGEIGGSPKLAQALIAAIIGNEIARETVATGMRQGRQRLARIFALGQAQGQIRADCQPAAMGLAFQQAVLGALMVWAIHPQIQLARRLQAAFEDYWKSIEAA